MSYRTRFYELSKYRNEKHPVVSLYVNVTPPWEFSSRVNSLVRTKIKELREKKPFDDEENGKIEKLLNSIEEQLKNREGGFDNTKLLAVFADTEGYREEFELPYTHPDVITVSPTPYVKPLMVLQQQFLFYGVVVVDSFKARMFSYGGGKLQELEDIFTEEEVRGARDEAFHGLGEQRYQRYIKDHKLRHMKQTADTLFHTFQKNGYDYLIIGGSGAKEINLLKDNLHSYLKKKLIGDFNANPENDVEAIRKKVVETAGAWDKKRENELIDRIHENAYSDGKAVLGVGPTIKALMNGQVHTLMLQPDVQKEGYVCPNDHYISLSSRECPICSTPLEKRENILDEMVEETIGQNGEVVHLFNYPDKLENHETGALLRFTLQA